MISKFKLFFTQNLSAAPAALLESQPARPYRWIAILWLVGLYVLGIVGFGTFFEWGQYDSEYHDWAQITAPRLQFLRTAVRAQVFPLHISDPSTLHGWTLRYLAVPDAFISPQYYMLAKLPLPWFNLVNVWLMYTLGFGGLLVLGRKLRLSAISFSLLFLLFNFNGQVLAHYSVGHATWGGYFLFPWFVWLMLRLLDGDSSWRLTTLTAGVLFVMWLQGSFHQVVYSLMLLGFIGVCVPRTFWTVIRSGAFALLASAFRLLPALLLLRVFSPSFLNGYPSLYAIWFNLVSVPHPLNAPWHMPGMGDGIGAWEATMFVGLLGGVFLLFFGFYRGLLRHDAPYRALLLPLGALVLLSIGPVYQILIWLQIPMLQGERVATRLFSVVLVFGLVLGAERLQRWLENIANKSLTLAACLLGLGVTLVDLWQDLSVWRLSNRLKDFWIVFQDNKWFVNNNYSDTLYLGLVFGGLALTVLTFLVLGWLSWREMRKKRLARE